MPMSPSGVTGPLPSAIRCLDLLAQEPVIFDRVVRAAEGAEDRADIIDAAEIGVDRRGFVLALCSTQMMIVLGHRGLAQIFAQAVDVELDAGDPLELRDDLLLELLDHVFDHVRRDLAVRQIGRVEHDRFAVVLLAQQLEPLHEGEAAGVGQQQHVRVRQLRPFGPILPLAIMPMSDFT